MRIIYFLMLTGFCFSACSVFAQDILPGFTVKNNKGKISVSWQNKYAKQVKGISIQRSYDSSKNFSSIHTIDNPNDVANGFLDINTPYDKMYYRLFIVFDSGVYIFTESHRPDPDPSFNFTNAIKKIREENEIKPETEKITGRNIKQRSSTRKIKNGEVQQEVKNETPPARQNSEDQTAPPPKKEEIPYPSQYIYTGKDNNVVINLQDFKPDKYSIRFYDEDHKFLFALNKITDGYFIIEKVNFFHAGWFFFELYDEDNLKEKNKFYLPKD